MAHKTVYNFDAGIIETKVNGHVNISDFKEIISEITSIAKVNNCLLWLSDYTTAKPKFYYSQIYEVPKIINESAEILSVIPCQIKRAIVVDKEKDGYKFSQTVCTNQGQTLEIFLDYKDAVEWLTSANEEN